MKIYIGYDAREEVAYKVAKYSIEVNTRFKPEILPLYHKELRKSGVFYRPWLTDPMTGNLIDVMDLRPFSTDFSHSRFLVPFLSNYEGWALFMDCDMIVQCDINELFEMRDNRYAAMVVKHNHKPPETVKMDGVSQQKYHRKNWSSFVLWNCAHPANRILTTENVNTRPGSWLHGFEWLADHQIQHIGYEWNWIEGSSPGLGQRDIKVIHYTNGGPWFPDYQDVMFADVWTDYYERWQRNFSAISSVPCASMEL